MTQVSIDEQGWVQLRGLSRFDINVPNDGGVYISKNNFLWAKDGSNCSVLELPDWLADGIRELVKNKIEQENNRGA